MKNKPKVLIVHNYYQIPGGEDTVVANEKKLLESHGHKVILYTRSNSELKEMSFFQKCMLPFITIYNIRTVTDIKRIIKKEKIDIVHVHNTLSLISPSVYYAANSCGVPVVQTIHNFRLLCPGATFYRDGHICEDCVKHGLRCAVKHNCYRNSKLQTLVCVISTKIHGILGIYGKLNYICLTKFNKEKLLQLNHQSKKRIIDSSRVYIKPNFTFEVTDEVTNIEIERQRVLNNEYFLFIGRVEKNKGIDILLQAFALLPDHKLVIAGTGAHLDGYKELASSNVSFVGFLNRQTLAEVTRNAKAVIVPSQLYETFGMIIVEAYAAHTPVLVGDIGNIASLVDEGVTGLKFKYDSVDALKKTIDSFNGLNSDEIESMAENGYKKYLADFSPEKNYWILEKIYKNMRL